MQYECSADDRLLVHPVRLRSLPYILLLSLACFEALSLHKLWQYASELTTRASDTVQSVVCMEAIIVFLFAFFLGCFFIKALRETWFLIYQYNLAGSKLTVKDPILKREYQILLEKVQVFRRFACLGRPIMILDQLAMIW